MTRVICILAALSPLTLACSDEADETKDGEAECDCGVDLGADGALAADGATGGDAQPSSEPSPRADGRYAGWTPETHEKGAPNYDQLFGDRVQRLDITIAPERWQAMQDDLTELIGPFGEESGGLGPEIPEPSFSACEQLTVGDPCAFEVYGVHLEGFCGEIPSVDRDLCIPSDLGTLSGLVDGFDLVGGEPAYVQVTLTYEGRQWHHVGMRFKGNASLRSSWQQGRRKLGFRLHFDKYEDDHPAVDNQRFYGFKKMTFAGNYQDPSYLRDKLASELFRAQGVPAAHVAFYEVYVDVGDGPGYWGLYSMIEDISDQFTEAWFEDDDGNMYKPDGFGADWTAFNEAAFKKKSNEDEGDWSDIEAAVAALHADRSDAGAWRAALDATFDLDGFLNWLAIRQAMENWDTYGSLAHNYYLYGDPKAGGRLVFIPWDHNDVLKESVQGDASFTFETTKNNWPLIRFLYDDPVWRVAYFAHLRAVLDGPYAEAPFYARVDELFALIAPSVAAETAPYTQLDGAHEVDSLKAHSALRRSAAEAALSAQPPGP